MRDCSGVFYHNRVRGRDAPPADGRELLPGGQTYAYSQKRAYNGDTRVISGTAKLNSAEPELVVTAGDALAVTRDGCDVLSVAMATDAPPDEARLSLAKDTFVRVSGLEGDAKKLSVTGEGTLILSATNSESRLCGDGDIFATMENPDFEEFARQKPTSTSWTIKATRDYSTTVLSNATRLANASVSDPTRLKDDPDFSGAPYGTNLGVNNRALDFCQSGRATQPIHFDEPGLYRLRLSSRSRVWENGDGTVNMGYGGNQVAVFLADGQGNTNEIYRTPSVYATNFTFRSALFRVANAGDYTFGLMSLNGMPLPDGTALKVGSSGSDCEIFVDQVSVKKAAEADGGPQLPEDFALHLAAGTKLRLDFAGTNRIGSCRIDGHVTSGYIDATHPSGLVVGTGCLYVEPKGAMILIR